MPALTNTEVQQEAAAEQRKAAIDEMLRDFFEYCDTFKIKNCEASPFWSRVFIAFRDWTTWGGVDGDETFAAAIKEAYCDVSESSLYENLDDSIQKYGDQGDFWTTFCDAVINYIVGPQYITLDTALKTIDTAMREEVEAAFNEGYY